MKNERAKSRHDSLKHPSNPPSHAHGTAAASCTSCTSDGSTDAAVKKGKPSGALHRAEGGVVQSHHRIQRSLSMTSPGGEGAGGGGNGFQVGLKGPDSLCWTATRPFSSISAGNGSDGAASPLFGASPPDRSPLLGPCLSTAAGAMGLRCRSQRVPHLAPTPDGFHTLALAGPSFRRGGSLTRSASGKDGSFTLGAIPETPSASAAVRLRELQVCVKLSTDIEETNEYFGFCSPLCGRIVSQIICRP